jgi:hypothetical protein
LFLESFSSQVYCLLVKLDPTLFRSSYLGQALGLAQYHYYTLDLLARKKKLITKMRKLLGQALGLAQYHYYKLDLLAMKKSLLRKFVNYNRKKFITLAPGVDLIKNFGRKFTYSIM